MITTNSQYLHCLSYGQTLQNLINGVTAGMDPAMVVLGPVWGQTIYNSLQAVVNQYIATHPTSGSTGVVVTSF